MPDNVTQFTVVSQGGYDSSQNYLNLDMNFPGMASDLLNYEVGLNGGYRKINGFQPLEVSAEVVTGTAPGTGKVLGVFIYNGKAGDEIWACRKSDVAVNTYTFYKKGSGVWTDSHTRPYTSGAFSVDKVRAAQFNVGGVNYMIFVDGVNPPTIYNGTTWYNLTVAGAGTSVSPGGNQLLERPAAVTVFKNHIFIGRDGNLPDVICHSAPEDVFNWTAAAGSGQIICSDRVVNIYPFRDTLFVFCDDRIRKVTVPNTDFVIDDVTTKMGCLAADSIQEVAGDVYFLAPDGIRPISGTDKIGDVQLATVSKSIHKYISDLIAAYNMNNVDSVVIRNKTQYRLFVHDPNNSDDGAGVGIIAGIRGSENASWEYSRLLGMRVSCATSGFFAGKEMILHGGYNGGVYQQESGDTFNGTNIVTVYQTPYLTMGDPKVMKLFRSVTVFYRLEGSVTVQIRATYDWDDSQWKNPASYINDNQSVVSVYGDGSEYGDGTVYGALVENPVLETNIEGSGHSIQLTFTTSDDHRSHSILGFVIEYTNQARR